MREYDAYLFDADGTILDTRRMIDAAYMHMAQVLGVTVNRERVQATIGLPVLAQLRELLGHDREDSFYEAGRILYTGHQLTNYRTRLALFPGVAEGLRDLKARGKKLAVVTSRRMESLGPFLNAVGIDGYFDALVTPESTARHKPEPEPALCAMEKLGVGPEQSVFIGDATFDIECGHAAGMDTVLVGWGMPCDGWAVQPEYVIREFGELCMPRGEK